MKNEPYNIVAAIKWSVAADVLYLFGFDPESTTLAMSGNTLAVVIHALPLKHIKLASRHRVCGTGIDTATTLKETVQ